MTKFDDDFNVIDDCNSKECRLCHTIKPLSEFPYHKGCKDGYDSRCKKCKYHNDATITKRGKKERDNPYPIDGVCQFPGCTTKAEKTKLHYDHDHITDDHRGWLCRPHNHILGFLGDNETKIKEFYLNTVSYIRNAENRNKKLKKNRTSIEKFLRSNNEETDRVPGV